jgi:excisionase family DNA binding protein
MVYNSLMMNTDTAQTPEIMTPEQAAEYLQLSRETIYRYIRQGKLSASRLGRSYRISKHDLDTLLWENRTEHDIPLRRYTREEIDAFIRDDQMDEETARIAEEFLASHDMLAQS